MARYDSAGALDPTFEGDGIGLYSAGFGASAVSAVAVQSDGKYVAAGATSDGSVYHSTLIRVSP